MAHRITGSAAIGAITALQLTAAVAEAGVIDMNDIVGVEHGTVVDTQFPGVTISAVNGDENLAVAFDSAEMSSRDPDLQDPFGSPNGSLGGGLSAGPTDPGFILIVQENGSGCGDGVCDNPDDDAGGGTLSFLFDTAVTLLSLDLFDLDAGNQNESATIRLFSGPREKTILGEVVGDGNSLTVDLVALFDPVSTAEVTQLDIVFSSSGAVNNIAYSVPLPGSFVLLGAGLLWLGVARRRKRS